MENAGQLIEDEELRAQIKGSGIGDQRDPGGDPEKTDQYQISRPEQENSGDHPDSAGRDGYDVVEHSIRSLLNPELTASWEKGTHLCGGGKHHPGRIHDETGSFHYQQDRGSQRTQQPVSAPRML